MESQRRNGSRSTRNATVDSIPALTIFAGAVVALVIGIIDPRQLFTTGGVILFVSAILGFVIRWLVPKENELGSAPRRSGVELVIFDCDGVLVDTEPICVAIEARALGELGWPIGATEVARRWIGRSSAEQLADISNRLGPDAAARFDELTAAATRREFERSLVPVDGVRSLLDHLDGIELPYCVTSSGTHERIRLVLGIVGLMGRFAGNAFSSTDVAPTDAAPTDLAQGNPAPDLFLLAAQRMGASPGRCAVVEDSVYGVRAALTAGMTAYGYAGGLTAPRDLAAAGAVVFHDMNDLVELLSPAS